MHYDYVSKNVGVIQQIVVVAFLIIVHRKDPPIKQLYLISAATSPNWLLSTRHLHPYVKAQKLWTMVGLHHRGQINLLKRIFVELFVLSYHIPVLI